MDTNASPRSGIAAARASVMRPVQAAAKGGGTLAEHYRTVRRFTESLCEPLAIDDYVIQSMPDASPVKWHLAHTTWFFETFVVSRCLPGYRPFHPLFGFLFNSYYEAEGPRWPRPERGLLSRPTVAEVFRYRAHVDDHMNGLLSSSRCLEVAPAILLGINHEQQHQELLITDLKHAWSTNPLHPVYREAAEDVGVRPPMRWLDFAGGLVWTGYKGDDFAFDNEAPQHRVFLNPYRVASRLVTNAEYLEFIDDGGYERAELWLSDGWAARQARRWTTPLYWYRQGNEWFTVTMAGPQPLNPVEPVCHVSYYEADAYARWTGARLLTEAEWENAAASVTVAGHFIESGRFHPAAGVAADDAGPLHQPYGDVWQWTASPYTAYPGYRTPPGALGEYNGKFMCNQMVLRGASCATPRSHARRTYRNFFPPDARWQFSGVRLARDPD
ncbi:MAG TPA: ergothioneine biosynthesis protein EgtB [Candidatus Binataceae bacterium]|nr:ergothioneine biosynthesis protein EgtB [Candidatus Binataceae bacterium]